MTDKYIRPILILKLRKKAYLNYVLALLKRTSDMMYFKICTV